MSAERRTPPRMGVAEFIEMIRPWPDEERWELLDGVPVLMAPQTERHQTIVMNILRALDRLSRKRGCRTLPGLGMLNADNDDYAPIPDVVIRCGPPLDGGYAYDAVFLAEVLSPSTMSNDRGRKLDFYRTLPALRTILIVYADEIRVEAWQRPDAGDWTRAVLKRRGDALALPEIGGSIGLDAVYEDLDVE